MASLRLGLVPTLIVCAVALAHLAGFLAPVQNALTEFRFGFGERNATGQIVFVEIDPRSLQAIGSWPWPRSLHARAVERLNDAGAAEIAFDIDFSSPSTAPEDAAFERALGAAGGTVALATFRQSWSGAVELGREHINEPLEQFSRHAWKATVNVIPDRDGAVRELRYGDTINGEFVPSVAALYGGLPPDAREAFDVDFSIDPQTVPRVSYADIVLGEVVPDVVRGSKILIGASAAELRDHFAVPRHGILSGAMLQILGAESIIQGRALVRSSLLAILAALAVILALTTFATRGMRWGPRTIAFLALSALLEAGAIAVQVRLGVIAETAPLHAAIFLIGAWTVVREVDLRGLLLRAAKTETHNIREILDQVVADNFDGIVVLDAGGTILQANGSAARILRLDGPGDLEGRSDEALPDAIRENVRDVLQRLAAGGTSWPDPIEAECRVGDDTAVIEYLATPSRLAKSDGTGGDAGDGSTIVCLTFRDVTERNRAQAEIAHMALYDSLTGLANRNRLGKLVDAALAKPEPRATMALIYFDLDRFKNVNDTLGHHHGDLLLRAVAERATLVAGENGFVARFGGDEFVMVLNSVASPEAARASAQRLIERLRAPYDLDGHRVIVGASAGLALSQDVSSADDLVRNADVALHQAKQNGGNIVGLYEPSMGKRLRNRRKLELDLWKAFERDEFEMFFQPQVSLADESLSGAEALVRWNSPERGGYVSPGEFIAAVEQVGLMNQLGAWILSRSCDLAAQWEKPVKVAVNLSAHQIRTGDLIATIERSLAKAGLPASRLDLEITESLLVDESPVTASALARIREMGIGLALDDFGTGYSSLSYIRRFPITKIKIDQSFVRGLPADRGALAIVHAVTALSSSLGLETTAEGVEKAEQTTLLKLAGCWQGQGYLFGRPMPAQDFAALVAGRSTTAAAA